MNTSNLAETETPRINYKEASKIALPAMLALQDMANKSGLEKPLLELVKLRASNLNGCAFCIDMHAREAIAAGETAQRLLMVSAWQEASVFSPREKAALRWTDALTDLAGNGVDDETFDAVREWFTDEELSDLTLAIVAINGWNRFNVGFRIPAAFAFRAHG